MTGPGTLCKLHLRSPLYHTMAVYDSTYGGIYDSTYGSVYGPPPYGSYYGGALPPPPAF